ncbi:CDP-diacylglycerol--serine O-phosphatidyltransferase [archaeon SCG-AAA382B04]|nr:CDP-diacylglycerol--serine O-phosphatidyltransferase [archaeon SCG-AAA382B04]
MKKKENNLISLIRYPDLASLGNLLLGFLGVIFLLRNNEVAFLKSILFAGLLDGLDGLIARRRYQDSSSSFGVEIDSLADLVSFGFAPALFFWVKTDLNIFYLVIPMAFLAVALLRLARYNITKEKSGFIGVPTTCTGLILIILLSFNIQNYNLIMGISSLVLTSLMISPFHFPKFRTKFLVPIGLLLVFLISSQGNLFYIGKIILLALLLAYILISPVIEWNSPKVS